MAHRRIRKRPTRALARHAAGAFAAALLASTLITGGAQAMPRLMIGVEEARAGAGEVRERAERLPEVRNAAGEPLHVGDGACERRMARAASQGLRLPDGWKLHCVGQGLDWQGGTHWGVTCPYEECPEGDGPYVSVSNPTYYVVAHALCHANFGNDELMADACAAEHGASLEDSPYR